MVTLPASTAIGAKRPRGLAASDKLLTIERKSRINIDPFFAWHYGDMIRIALFVGRINEERIGVVQISDCLSCPRNPEGAA
jgi:hypothetical protein